ncbi:NIPSNAP family protein [Burkholderia sp. JKS000303]|uniref:NIPSNAP family protein n=1 Tax=Burkholderia sp. JKS000303 TaxID=1938747 RepID=UPI000BF6E4B7|nr:NIPSNAP family protein [Burkholderia sp. JKS000303]PFH20403.1 NIPSNAP protein [Burkholderia sp. JKS000303]
MIHELREYVIERERAPGYFALFRDVGMPIRGNEYGRLVGNWTIDEGTIRFLHVWSYASLAERAEKRAALGRVPGWTDAFLPGAVAHVSSQSITILNPIAGTVAGDGTRSVEHGARVLHALRCKLGRAAQVAAALARTHADADGVWVAEFPDPNAVYLLNRGAAPLADPTALAELGVLHATATAIDAGPYRPSPA